MLEFITYQELIGCTTFDINITGDVITSYIHIVNSNLVYVRELSIERHCRLQIDVISEIIKNRYAIAIRAIGNNIAIDYFSSS